MGFFTTSKLLILFGALIFGGGASLIGSYALDNHQLKRRVHDLESELLQKYIQISTQNQELARQAEEISRANASFDRYKQKSQKKYKFTESATDPCNKNILENLLQKWSEKDD